MTRLPGVGRIYNFNYYRVTHDTVDMLAVWRFSRGKLTAL